MKLYRFDAEVGRPISAFGSENMVLSRILRSPGAVQIGCIHLGPGGTVGYHQAVGPQLFLVVQGSGWVRGEGPERIPIAAGQAAFWVGGEWHGAGTEQELVALVIEGEGLDPAAFMASLTAGEG